MTSNVGTLYIVATPIGNRTDLSPRAIETLQSVDLIAAEDTRHFQTLRQFASINTPCQPYHAHNEQQATQRLLQKLREGESLALVSDAGTPLISDPGSCLVRKAQEENIPVCPIPGPCAAITALSASGIETNTFYFAGFLSNKAEKRANQLKELCQKQATVILYESVHRIESFMTTLKNTLEPTRLVCLARELTKRFEQIKTAPIEALYPWFVENTQCRRGEYVVIVQGASDKSDCQDECRRVLHHLLKELPVKQAAKLAAQITGQPRNESYKIALEMAQSLPR